MTSDTVTGTAAAALSALSAGASGLVVTDVTGVGAGLFSAVVASAAGQAGDFDPGDRLLIALGPEDRLIPLTAEPRTVRLH